MKKVVVTGASGFVGSAVIKNILERDVQILALDVVDDPSFRLDLANPKLTYKKCDIFQLDEVRKYLLDGGFDAFYHFAWIGSAGPLREDIDVQIKNATGTVELMKLAHECNIKKFICAGTIMEFETFSAIYAQGNKPQMSYIYGVGKQLAHLLCKPIANKLGIDLVWAYITNAFGVGEKSPRLINSTIRKCIKGEPLEFTSGTQKYDFLYIDDVAEAFYLLGEKGKANKSYVIGSGKAGPLRTFLEKAVRMCDANAKPLFGNMPFTGTDLEINVFSIQELQNDCGFEPKVSFEEGIKRTYEWLKKEEA